MSSDAREPGDEKLRARALALEAQRARLEDELQTARREILQGREERERQHQALCALERENRDLSERYVEVERQNSNLTLLCGASYRLHGSLERREVLERIREIVADLVGSEEIAIFTLPPGGSALLLEEAFGTTASFPEIPLGSGLIGRCVQDREIYVAGRSGGAPLPYETDLQASIPLLLEGKPTGALAIFRLLPQKPGLEARDIEIFDLLATHAAAALHCAALQAQVVDRIAS